jgi:hypothetical protein
LEVKELAMDLKALDPACKVDPCILLIANRRKGEGAIICPNLCPKGPAEWIVARKEVREVGRRLADPRKYHVALLATGWKDVVRRAEVEGPASQTATRKLTKSVWGTGLEA